MSFFTGLFNQTAVHWGRGVLNNAGNAAWNAGAEVASGVRWEEGKGTTNDQTGNTIEFDATVYTEGSESIVNEDRIYLGSLSSLTAAQQADPTKTEESWPVVHVNNTPSVGADNTLKEIFLRAPA